MFFRRGVKTEFFKNPLLFIIIQCPIEAELIGNWAIDEVAGIGSAHLEQHAIIKFTQGLAVHNFFNGIEGVRCDNSMDSYRWAFTENICQLFVEAYALFIRLNVPVVFFFIQHTKTLQAGNEQEYRLAAIMIAILQAVLNFEGQLGQNVRGFIRMNKQAFMRE